MFTDHCPKWSLQAKSQHTQITYGLLMDTRLHTELSILGLSLCREWGLHKYSGVSYTMGFIHTTEEDYFCQITAYIKAHVCLYCFWHPGALFTRFCQPRFLSEQRPRTTIGWTVLQNLSRGLSWGWACMRSWYENMAWLDFYFSKWSHSLKALIILTGEKYSFPKSQQEKIREKTSEWSCGGSHVILHWKFSIYSSSEWIYSLISLVKDIREKPT